MNLSNVFGIIPTTAVADKDDEGQQENSSATLLFIIIAGVLAWGWLSPPLIVQLLVLVLFVVAHTVFTSDDVEGLATTTTYTIRVPKEEMQDGDEDDDFCHLKCQSNLFVGRFNFGMFGSI